MNWNEYQTYHKQNFGVSSKGTVSRLCSSKYIYITDNINQ